MKKYYNFISLIEDFINHKITVSQFERMYMDKYLSNTVKLGDELFDIMDWLFAEVDAYTDLPLEPTDDPSDHLNEDQLRESAKETLAELYAYEKKHGNVFTG
jgi:Bacterial self-protective colicin-like immunity